MVKFKRLPCRNYLFLISIAIFISGCSSKREYMGLKVYDREFKIAGEKIVKIPVTDAGPISAENNFYRVERADIVIGSSKDSPSQPELIWSFVLKVKEGGVPEQIMVKKVGPGKVESLYVKDDKPVVRSTFWAAATGRININHNSCRWVFKKKPSVLIMEFEIKDKNGETYSLYQPVWISQRAKLNYMAMIRKVRNFKKEKEYKSIKSPEKPGLN